MIIFFWLHQKFQDTSSFRCVRLMVLLPQALLSVLLHVAWLIYLSFPRPFLLFVKANHRRKTKSRFTSYHFFLEWLVCKPLGRKTVPEKPLSRHQWAKILQNLFQELYSGTYKMNGADWLCHNPVLLTMLGYLWKSSLWRMLALLYRPPLSAHLIHHFAAAKSASIKLSNETTRRCWRCTRKHTASQLCHETTKKLF